MAKIPIPFTSMKVDTDEPIEALKAVAFLVVGFMLLYFTQDLGSSLKKDASETLGMGSEGTRPNVI